MVIHPDGILLNSSKASCHIIDIEDRVWMFHSRERLMSRGNRVILVSLLTTTLLAMAVCPCERAEFPELRFGAPSFFTVMMDSQLLWRESSVTSTEELLVELNTLWQGLDERPRMKVVPYSQSGMQFDSFHYPPISIAGQCFACITLTRACTF